MIHDHPSRLWPKDWPNAEEVLGLGTWDAFLEFPKDFELVFETAPAPPAPPPNRRPVVPGLPTAEWHRARDSTGRPA